ncbi:nucleotide sugar dehydrogenase [Halorientalis brevis]|uniref:UDP-N-acetyl-D-mannosamine dehydrogenase n=1 Tax=Halorientalis brevis TaxID=1126241 RepID=A0ABD6CDF8_9EURY|nr:nucleotide sugar dehydrogenase [Halorientalis brevis]
MHTRTSDRYSLYESSLESTDQRSALRNGDVPVAVYGLGKMGLPLAAVFAEVTGNTTGADIDPSVVESVNSGTCPVDGEPGLPEAIETTVEDGSLSAVSDPTAAATDAAIHVIIVPTLVEDGTPDLATLRAVAESIGRGLSPGDLVCVESTVPPRTCRDVVVPVLERESELELGEFGVAFCPERTSSGRALKDIRGAYPKVVGGVDDESTRAASVLYDEVSNNEIHAVADATTAECVKVFEGVYRDVNIALANELATMADELGTDVIEAIETANTQPYCDIHRPGPGVGGHCIPYYPYFLIEPFETETPLLRTARDVNDSMPAFTVRKLREALAENGRTVDDASVVVLGVAYRPGVEETRESPGLAIAELLDERGIDVAAVDPIVELEQYPVAEIALDELPEHDFDAVVLATDHDEFESLPWSAFEDVVVVDGRDALSDRVDGHPVYTIGVGDPVSDDSNYSS